jgi:hypothetical protein
MTKLLATLKDKSPAHDAPEWISHARENVWEKDRAAIAKAVR